MSCHHNSDATQVKHSASQTDTALNSGSSCGNRHAILNAQMPGQTVSKAN